MKLVEKHIISKNHKSYKEIDHLAFLSKNLYNKGNYIIRQEFIKTSKEVEQGKREKAKWIRYHELQKILQNSNDPDYIALPRKVSQQVLRQLDNNWKSFFKTIKEWKKAPDKFKKRPSLPKYKHKTRGRNILVYTIQAISKVELKNDIVKLSNTNIQIKTKQKNIQQARIIPLPNKVYKIEIVYEKEIEKRNTDKNRIASIDIGVDSLAAVTSNVKEFKPLIINGRPLKAINQYFNKRKAELLSALMKQDKNRRTSNRIERLTLKRNNKIEDYMHKASRMLVDKLVEFNIGTLVIGKNDGWKQKVNMGDRNNQNFTLIPHSKFIKMLEYKCKLMGIDVILQDESYTSKCSLIDLEPIEHRDEYVGRRISRGLFKSKDGIIINADINGSGNIMRKVIPNCLTTNGIEGFVVSPVRITPKGYYPYKQVS
jgi:putative transposase